MARTLTLSFEDAVFDFSINKVDRSKLYGYTSVEVKDDEGSLCSLATISDDGKHILSKGCTGYTSLNEHNEYVPTTAVKVVDFDGNPLEKNPSSFDVENIPLTVSSIAEYLTLSVKSVYQLETDDQSYTDALIAILKEHKVLKFNFSYRSDYNSDDAFLLQNEDTIFMIIGHISPFEFIGLEKQLEVADIMDDDDDDDFDFGAL